MLTRVRNTREPNLKTVVSPLGSRLEKLPVCV